MQLLTGLGISGFYFYGIQTSKFRNIRHPIHECSGSVTINQNFGYLSAKEMKKTDFNIIINN